MKKINSNDVIGKRFGKLVVTNEAPPTLSKDGYKVRYFYCECDCGKKDVRVSYHNLISNHTKSCGCIKKESKKLIDLTGKRFGRLVVLERAENVYVTKKTAWKCLCDCGNIVIRESYDLKNSDNASCGCYKKELNSKRFSKRNTYEFYDTYVVGKTSNGEEYFFDIVDYDKVKDYCWNIAADGSVVARGGRIYFHRFILGVTERTHQVDHINHIRHDNRRCNLRIVSNSENGMNKGLKSNNTSGCTGVQLMKNGKWCSSITKDGIHYYLGCYDIFEDAVYARKKAEELLFGEYSYDNSMNISKLMLIGEEKCQLEKLIK